MPPVTTPIRKRQLLRNADESFSNQSIVQDDEAERQERRKSLAPPRKSFNQEEVKSHFELCQKMFIENKITPKNAWNLRIIDYFMTMISSHNTGKEPLQAAATALEICTKVYACRVDDLHSEGMKLANSLAAQKEKMTEEHIDNEVDGEDGGRRKKKKKAKLTLNSERFVSKDIESMSGPVPQLANVPFTVETDGDPEQTTNLFTITVPFDQYYHDHLRDKETPCFLSQNDVDHVNVDVIEKVTPKVRNFKICVEFENFEVNVLGADLNNSMSLNFTQGQNVCADGQPVYDEQGQPIVELDGSIHDIFAEQNDEAVDREEELVNGCHRAYQEVQIVSFCPDQEMLKDLTDGSVMTDDISRWANMIWVGPNHWKNKRLKRSALRYSGAVEQQKITRKRKLQPLDDDPIDFFVDPPKIDFTAKTKQMKRIIDESKYLVHRNYLKRAPSDQTLMLMNYELRKGYRAGGQDSEQEFEHEYQDYNYNNLNDSQYCLAANNDGDEPAGDRPIDDAIQNDFNTEPLAQTIEEDILKHQNAMRSFNVSVDAIIANSSFQVPYAMRSKKVNMKRIKAAIIEILKENGVFSENITNTPDEVKLQSFISTYEQLNMDLPQTIAQEMSIPIAFFALLHLTNEKGLTLKMMENFKDIIITNEIPLPPHLRK